MWHQRWLIGKVRASSEIDEIRYMVGTPDGDIYDEVYDSPCDDVAAVRFGSRSWPPPQGLPTLRLEKFRTSGMKVPVRREEWCKEDEVGTMTASPTC